MIRFHRHLLVLALIGTPALATTVAPGADEYEAALMSFEQNDLASAEVHLKNALQQRPDHAGAQVLLGRLYLLQGRTELADSTLQTARSLGADRAEVEPLRMRIRLQQGDYRAVIEAFDPYAVTGYARAQMLRARGEARLELGRSDEAERSFLAAREAAPQSPDGDIGLSMLALHRLDGAGAIAAAERATSLAPQSAEAWTALATARQAAGEPAAALEAADRALKLDSRHAPAHAARVTALTALARYDEAREALERLRRQSRTDVRILLLAAELERARQDPAAAHARLADASLLLQAIPRETLLRTPSLLLLSGTVHEALGSPEKARADLSLYLERIPDHEVARRLLASVLLRLGEPRRALDILQPLLAAPQADADLRLLTLRADAHTQLGEHATAATLLERLVELGGRTPALLAELGTARMRSGQGDAALLALADAWAQQADARNGLLLASLQLGAGRPADALHTLDAIAARTPDNAVVLHLRGGARLGLGDRSGARADFERALGLAPGLHAAAVNLAQLDVAEGRPEAGIARLEALVAAQPQEAALRTDLGRLLQATGHEPEAVQAWEQARALDRRSLAPRLALAEYRLAHREPQLALDVAREALALAPLDPNALAAVGMSELALQQTGAAQATFRTLSETAGQQIGRLLRAARYQMLARAPLDAAGTLERARAIAPDNPEVLRALAEARLNAGQAEAAETPARALLALSAPPAEAWGLLGEILMARGRPAEAAAVYADGHARHPRSAYAVAIWRAYTTAGDARRGLPALEAWWQAHPADPDARAALAIAWPQLGEWTKAQALYESLAAARPDEPMILNNLALLYLRTGDARAVATAQRAQTLAPEHPVVLDTLGWVLVQRGETTRGVEFLQAAQARDATNPELRWHLGYALNRLGRKSEARRHIEQALASNAEFDGIEDARHLLVALPR